jgi:hypothetical protein
MRSLPLSVCRDVACRMAQTSVQRSAFKAMVAARSDVELDEPPSMGSAKRAPQTRSTRFRCAQVN